MKFANTKFVLIGHYENTSLKAANMRLSHLRTSYKLSCMVGAVSCCGAVSLSVILLHYTKWMYQLRRTTSKSLASCEMSNYIVKTLN